MAEFDIASKIVPAQSDPIGVAKGAIALQGGLLQNRLLQANVGQTLAQRAAAQSAIDPSTGQFDVDAYEAALAKGGASPEALLQAQQARQQKLQAQISQLGLTKAQLEVSAQELGGGAQVAQGILADGTKDPSLLSKQAIADAIDKNLIQAGLVRSKEGIAHAKGFEASLTDDPQQNAALLQQFVNQSTDITKAIGAVTNVDVGGHIVQQRINPATGQSAVVGQIDKTRTPGEKAGLVPTYNPATRTTELRTSGEIVGDQPQLPQGQHPQTSPALGEPQAVENNVRMAAALQQRASIVPQRKAALSELVGTLDKFATGPKAQTFGYLKGLASQFGVSTKGLDESKAAQDEFNKLAAQIALDQWGSLGGTGSNEQLATAVHANPNEVMSRMGIKNVAALLQGNEDAIGAQYGAWQKYKAAKGAGSYDTFLEGWNRYYDPRVFQAQHMTPAAVKEMLGSMTPKERETFKRDQEVAKAAGWLGG